MQTAVTDIQGLFVTLRVFLTKKKAEIQAVNAKDEEYQRKWISFGSSGPSTDELAHMHAAKSILDDMVNATKVLQQTIDPAELQIDIAVSHLQPNEGPRKFNRNS